MSQALTETMPSSNLIPSVSSQNSAANSIPLLNNPPIGPIGSVVGSRSLNNNNINSNPQPHITQPFNYTDNMFNNYNGINPTMPMNNPRSMLPNSSSNTNFMNQHQQMQRPGLANPTTRMPPNPQMNNIKPAMPASLLPPHHHHHQNHAHLQPHMIHNNMLEHSANYSNNNNNMFSNNQPHYQNQQAPPAQFSHPSNPHMHPHYHMGQFHNGVGMYNGNVPMEHQIYNQASSSANSGSNSLLPAPPQPHMDVNYENAQFMHNGYHQMAPNAQQHQQQQQQHNVYHHHNGMHHSNSSTFVMHHHNGYHGSAPAPPPPPPPAHMVHNPASHMQQHPGPMWTPTPNSTGLGNYKKKFF